MRVLPGLSLEIDDDLINAVLHECNLQFYHFVSFVIFLIHSTETWYYFDCTEYFVNEGTSTLAITVRRTGVVDAAASISKYNYVFHFRQG